MIGTQSLRELQVWGSQPYDLHMDQTRWTFRVDKFPCLTSVTIQEFMSPRFMGAGDIMSNLTSLKLPNFMWSTDIEHVLANAPALQFLHCQQIHHSTSFHVELPYLRYLRLSFVSGNPDFTRILCPNLVTFIVSVHANHSLNLSPAQFQTLESLVVIDERPPVDLAEVLDTALLSTLLDGVPNLRSLLLLSNQPFCRIKRLLRRLRERESDGSFAACPNLQHLWVRVGRLHDLARLLAVRGSPESATPPLIVHANVGESIRPLLLPSPLLVNRDDLSGVVIDWFSHVCPIDSERLILSVV